MNSKNRTIKSGIQDATPLALAIAAYGFPFGVLANQTGLGVLGALAMSLFIFSGSVQMITVAMLASGASFLSIISTATLLNLRNLLYGGALAPSLEPAKRWRRVLAFGISDEPFVLGIARFQKYGPDPLYFGVIVITFYISWAASSFLGAFVGDHIINPELYGLDLAFPMTFIAIFIPLIINKPILSTALAGGVLVVICETLLPGTPYSIILAGLFAPMVGCYIHYKQNVGKREP